MIHMVSAPFTTSTLRLSRRLFNDRTPVRIYTTLPNKARLLALLTKIFTYDTSNVSRRSLKSRANELTKKSPSHVAFFIFLLKNIRIVKDHNDPKIYSSDDAKAIILLHSGLVSQSNINRCKQKIFNCHTGWIPRDRGICSLDRALEKGYPPALSLHAIDGRIDRGQLFFRGTIQWHRSVSLQTMRQNLALYREAIFHDLIRSLDTLGDPLDVSDETVGNLATKERINEDLVRLFLNQGAFECPQKADYVFKKTEFDELHTRLYSHTTLFKT